MKDSIIIFLDSLIMSWIAIYIGTKLIKEKINYKNLKFWLLYLLYTVYVIVSYSMSANFIRVVLTFIVISFVFAKLYDLTVLKGLVLGFVVLFYTIIAEIIFTLIIIILYNFNIMDYKEIYFGDLFANIMIAIIIFFLGKITVLNKIFERLIKRLNIVNNKIILMISILMLISLVLILYYIYFDINLISMIVLGFFLVIIFTVTAVGLFNEKFDNYKLKADYDNLLKSLTEYEKMYTFQRMKNHEHNNELSVIRGLIESNNKKAIKYIDDLIGLKKDINSSWMETLKIIPEGGLRGILYYKLLEVENEKIKLEFSITKNFKTTSYLNLDENIKLNVCKLLGIYLDNAIQANKEIKEKYLSLNIDESEGHINFIIGNKFINNIDIEKIKEGGYSSKDKGRGHGLLIAKEILDKNKSIKNITKIVRDKFIQEIIIEK